MWTEIEIERLIRPYLKLLCGVLIPRILVWMVLKGHLLVSTLNIILIIFIRVEAQGPQVFQSFTVARHDKI